jgi:hypothetical protein
MAYDNQVSLGTSASAFGVAYLTGAAGSVLAFTPVSPLSNVLVSLSGTGWTAKVDRAYNGSAFAIMAADRSSTIFTANTAVVGQTVTNNGFNTVTGQIRKLVYLGYV